MKLRGVPLPERAPQLVKEWHPTKNGRLRPKDVAGGAKIKVWWRCARDPSHEWQAVVGERALKGSGCPHCPRRLYKGPSLAAARPEIAKEWHPTKNGLLKASEVGAQSQQRVWWQCAKGHEWQCVVLGRWLRQSPCPRCIGRSPTATLAERFPKVAAEWHPFRNGTRKPTEFGATSRQRVWWLCRKDRDHEWQNTIVLRTARKRGCPFCAKQVVWREYSLAACFPDLAAQWHPTKNGTLQPKDVAPRSNRRVWWRCSKVPSHSWFVSPSNRARQGLGCPFCSGHRVDALNAVATTRPDVAKQWHPTKNGDKTPRQFTSQSGFKAWWKCPLGPDHEWQAAISTRSRSMGCPFCNGNRTAPSTSLARLRPDLAKEWHRTKNGALRALDVTVQSSRRVWWKCRAGTDHEWIARIQGRSKGAQCPFCGLRELSVTNALSTQYPEIAAEWHPTKNSRWRAAEVICVASEFAWWRCPLGHAYRAAIRDRTNAGAGCPRCRLG